ncbi:putative retrotransposon ty1-copia subclass protein [Tanacetum coccineum]
MNGLTNDFDGFVRNYNMHDMVKTIGELHAFLIEYEKGLSKKAATPQVLAIQGGRIQKPNKVSQAAKGKSKAKGMAVELEEIQDKDTSPFENTSENFVKAGSLETQEDVVPIQMQSMKDNQVWRLVDLPPNGKTVGSKRIFKKNTDMDGNVYTYEARLVVKGYTQTMGLTMKKPSLLLQTLELLGFL